MRKSSYLITYSLFFLLSFILFPSFLGARTLNGRWMLSGVFVGLWLVGLLITKFYWPKEKKEIKSVSVWWSHKLIFLLVTAILFFILLPVINQPIRSKTDEAVHVHMGSALLEQSVFSAESITGLPVFITLRIVLWIGVVLLLWLFVKGRMDWFSKYSKWLSTNWQISVLSVLAICGIWVWAVIKIVGGFSYANINALVVPYESLGILFTTLSLILTGYSEFWIRLPYAIFSLLGAVFVYKIAVLYSTRRAGILAGVTYMIFPIVGFFFAHAKPITAETFFVVWSLYYFLRYQKHRSRNDLWVSMLITGIGTLFKMAAMMAFFVAGGYVFFAWILKMLRKQKIREITLQYFRTYVPPFIIAFLFIATRYIMHDLFHYPPTWPIKGAYTWYHLTSYAKLLPLQIGWIATGIFVIGLLYTIWKFIWKRDAYSGFLLAWLVVIYLIFSSHKVIVSPRWTVVLLPAVALIIGEVFNGVMKKRYVIGIFLFIAFSVSLFIGVHSFVYFDGFQSQFLPHKESAKWLAENVHGEGVYEMMIPYYFYERMAGVDGPQFVGVYTDMENQNLKTLHEYAQENGIKYVIYPVGNTKANPTTNVPIGPYSAWYYEVYYSQVPRHPWTNDVFTIELIKGLQIQSEYFKPVAEFLKADNQIMVSEVL